MYGGRISWRYEWDNRRAHFHMATSWTIRTASANLNQSDSRNWPRSSECILEYGSSVWDPSSIPLQEALEKVQKRAARFVTGNYIYETGSMTGILEQLKWESLKKRRRDSRIIMLYKGLKGAARIPMNDLVPPIRHVRNHHSLAFQTPFANTTFTSAVSSPRLLEDGIHLQILSFLLLKEQRTLLLSSRLL